MKVLHNEIDIDKNGIICTQEFNEFMSSKWILNKDKYIREM